MTPAQADLLRRLIDADRRHHARRALGELAHRDDRGVEIGSINGVDRRTAQALAERNLIELVELREGQVHAFLGGYDPYAESC